MVSKLVKFQKGNLTYLNFYKAEEMEIESEEFKLPGGEIFEVKIANAIQILGKNENCKNISNVQRFFVSQFWPLIQNVISFFFKFYKT